MPRGARRAKLEGEGVFWTGLAGFLDNSGRGFLTRRHREGEGVGGLAKVGQLRNQEEVVCSVREKTVVVVVLR